MARGMRFDVVGAVSSGVWNATAVAAGQVDQLEQLWLQAALHPTYSLRNLAFNRTPWNYLWLHHHFSRRFLDWDRLPASPIDWLVGVTRLRDLAPVVFSNRDGLDPFQIALASNTLPPIYPWPAKLGGRLYLDGGFTDNLIYEAVLARGCDRVVLVTQSADGSLWKSPRRRRHLIPHELRDRVVIIHPREPLEIGFNDLDPGRIRAAIEAGRDAAEYTNLAEL
jgi:predicted patatin/cPLA2 family phospholipase